MKLKIIFLLFILFTINVMGATIIETEPVHFLNTVSCSNGISIDGPIYINGTSGSVTTVSNTSTNDWIFSMLDPTNEIQWIGVGLSNSIFQYSADVKVGYVAGNLLLRSNTNAQDNFIAIVTGIVANTNPSNVLFNAASVPENSYIGFLCTNIDPYTTNLNVRVQGTRADIIGSSQGNTSFIYTNYYSTNSIYRGFFETYITNEQAIYVGGIGIPSQFFDAYHIRIWTTNVSTVDKTVQFALTVQDNATNDNYFITPLSSTNLNFMCTRLTNNVLSLTTNILYVNTVSNFPNRGVIVINSLTTTVETLSFTNVASSPARLYLNSNPTVYRGTNDYVSLVRTLPTSLLYNPNSNLSWYVNFGRTNNNEGYLIEFRGISR